jgi:hypothetical protein
VVVLVKCLLEIKTSELQVISMKSNKYSLDHYHTSVK